MTLQAQPPYQVGTSHRDILRMSLPISLSILVPQINFITNNIFLGGLGEQALAAAGITGVYYLFFAVLGNGLNNGMQALIARRAGEQRIEDIARLFAQGLRLALGFAFLGILLTWTLAPWILGHSLASDELRRTTLGFIRLRIFGLPLLYVYQMRNALLVGTNQSKFLIYGTLAEALVNIVLDFGLIYGHFGLPRMGFNGAALASIIAEGSGLFVVYAVIHFQGIGARLQLMRHLRFDLDNTRLILVQSLPLIVQYGISIGSWVYFFILVEHHGQRDLAVSNSMRNIFGICGIFSWAFASTTNAMVSNIIGQGKRDQVLFLVRRIVRLSLSFSLLIAIGINVFPRLILSIYGQDQAFVETAIPVLRVVSIAVLLMSIGTIWPSAVTGSGNTRINLAIEGVTIVIYCVYIYLTLWYYDLPILYGWMSEWVYWASSFLLSWTYMRSGRWGKRTF
jgi:putative MATE family efflux protein